ncbi:unnamed protein product [Orchesella dallaii]|uniref:Uncharacterized protein n=1 Tax=Orchesella dallaii TaxID=48710 RepID=A0ABP1Q767_9HEXA
MAGDPKSQVWLTSALTESDVPQALTLCFSLKRVFTCRKIGVIVSKKLTNELIEFLYKGFDYLFYLEEGLNTAKLKEQDFVKLFPLTLKPFEMCVFLSPTMLAVKNCDHIFEENRNHRSPCHLLRDPARTDLFVIRPSWKVFEDLMKDLMQNSETDLETYIRGKRKTNAVVCRPLADSYSHLLSVESLPESG